jgi:hypothetical protein
MKSGFEKRSDARIVIQTVPYESVVSNAFEYVLSMLVSTTGEADRGQLFGPGKLVQWCQSDCFKNWKSKV